MILSDIDDLALWTSCRRVSKMLRAEAERQFATQRLKQLHTYWNVSGLTRHQPKESKYTFFASIKRFLSIDDLRVTFSMAMYYQNEDADGDSDVNNQSKSSGAYGHVHKLLSNEDPHFDAGSGNPELSQVCQLGPYFHDVPLHNIAFRLHSDMISFDWKPILNCLFDLYAHTEYLARELGGADLSVSAAENELLRRYGNWKTLKWDYRIFWVCTYGSTWARVQLESAYVERLKRFSKSEKIYSKPGVNNQGRHLDFVALKELRTKSYVERSWEMRNEYIF